MWQHNTLINCFSHFHIFTFSAVLPITHHLAATNAWYVYILPHAAGLNKYWKSQHWVEAWKGVSSFKHSPNVNLNIYLTNVKYLTITRTMISAPSVIWAARSTATKKQTNKQTKQHIHPLHSMSQLSELTTLVVMRSFTQIQEKYTSFNTFCCIFFDFFQENELWPFPKTANGNKWNSNKRFLILMRYICRLTHQYWVYECHNRTMNEKKRQVLRSSCTVIY